MDYVNEEGSDGVTLCVQDWNGDYFIFYAHINLDNYEDDIKNIQKRIAKENWRDGDVRAMLVDYFGETEHFYDFMYNASDFVLSEILNPEYWEVLEEKKDGHFEIIKEQFCDVSVVNAQCEDYSVFEDWDDALEIYYPELYKELEKNHGFSCFDSEAFFNSDSTSTLEDGRVVFWN